VATVPPPTEPAARRSLRRRLTGGPLARVRDGDVIRLDAQAGRLEIKVEPAEFAARAPSPTPRSGFGFGREYFGHMRAAAGPAEAGASVLFEDAA